jgi:hypothetical protein
MPFHYKKTHLLCASACSVRIYFIFFLLRALVCFVRKIPYFTPSLFSNNREQARRATDAFSLQKNHFFSVPLRALCESIFYSFLFFVPS